MTGEEIQKTVEELLQKTPFSVSSVSVGEDAKSGYWWCSVLTDDSRFLIGRGGETLRALNHLIKKMVQKKIFGAVSESGSLGEDGVQLLVDVNNYQKDRVESLRTMAHMMAERARFFKSNVEVDPMSSFERRIIHEFLADSPDVKTESKGDGLSRRVVISYVEKAI